MSPYVDTEDGEDALCRVSGEVVGWMAAGMLILMVEWLV